ncbi:hypothetical protein SAMN05444678_103139 [Sphingomonas sp. YR710]|nr:hypothetical protein SAMN05444678_103139 [Sphingomonas sp. YR710]
MKYILIAAALIVGTPALAQDTPSGPQSTPPAAAPTMGSDMPATPASPTPPAATAPAANAAPAFSPTPVDSASLPKCSRTVTDKCIQSGAAHKRKK